jgi:endo-1,3(4)-beta-glucanase
MSDMGNNFGFSFYNDHHFHLGYHLNAAATVGVFDHSWLRAHWEQLLLYVRDIANPSRHDPYFPAARHKDWYLGSSWASGVVTINPNGRNEESSAEAIAAYEGVALLGEAGMMAFSTAAGRLATGSPGTNGASEAWAEGFATASRIYDFGRLLLSTEVRSAQRYWHVRASPAPRVYPDIYAPKVVGMLWQTLAQEQTWFGPEEWKSYGIQLLPFTPAAAKRDDPLWVAEMLPPFNASCAATPVCAEQGWSVLVLLSLATVGKWQEARQGILALPDAAFEGAGGNGHSRTNSLWWIATRPALTPDQVFHPATHSAALPSGRAGGHSTLTVAGRAVLGVLAAAAALAASPEL